MQIDIDSRQYVMYMEFRRSSWRVVRISPNPLVYTCILNISSCFHGFFSAYKLVSKTVGVTNFADNESTFQLLLNYSDTKQCLDLRCKHRISFSFFASTWPWVKTVVPFCSHQNRWDLWMLIHQNMAPQVLTHGPMALVE